MLNHTLSNVESEQFFSPSTTSWLDAMLSEYDKERENIDRVSSFFDEPSTQSAMEHFLSGYRKFESSGFYGSCEKIFIREHAISSLNSKYWNNALQMTDVLDYMPSKRRDEWREQISGLITPDFDEDTVRATLLGLMNQRIDFLAEMVDGIFTGLSGEHVTNRPEGFGKRMIIDGVYCTYYRGHKAGLIHDMRCVVAKLRGFDNPGHMTTEKMLNHFRRSTGTWHMVDAGAFRIRVYKNGNAHLEINPEIAYRLNQILAYLHPMAIPAPHRRRPNKKNNIKEFNLIERPIPNVVLGTISSARISRDGKSVDLGYEWEKMDKHIKQEIRRVMEAVGGAYNGRWSFEFDYDISDVVGDMLASGVIPDERSHQFYPTPEKLAKTAVEMADIQDGGEILEPSAGQGGIAEFLPQDRTTCLEINSLNSSILRAKGYQVATIDFLTWEDDLKYSRIVMNPPFSEGRWQEHVKQAARYLASDGVLVAILPSSAKNKFTLPDMHTSWSDVYPNEFSGTGISVVIMRATYDE